MFSNVILVSLLLKFVDKKLPVKFQMVFFIISNMSPFLSLEIIRKLSVFCFQGDQKRTFPANGVVLVSLLLILNIFHTLI